MGMQIPLLVEKMKARGLDVKLVPISDWDDELPNLLEEDGVSVERVDGTVLAIDGRAAIGLAQIRNGKAVVRWEICYNWVPLCFLDEWEECFVENWRERYPGRHYFAKPTTEYHEPEELELCEKVKQVLEELGVETAGFEGFFGWWEPSLPFKD